MGEDFKWTDELVKDMIYHNLPTKEEYFGNLQKCLDDFKQSKLNSSNKDWEIVNGGFVPPDMKMVIHSVRRLSDGEVFSVGDKVADLVGDYYKNKSIKLFAVHNETMYAIMEDEKGFFPLRDIQKAKQPLFTKEQV